MPEEKPMLDNEQGINNDAEQADLNSEAKTDHSKNGKEAWSKMQSALDKEKSRNDKLEEQLTNALEQISQFQNAFQPKQQVNEDAPPNWADYDSDAEFQAANQAYINKMIAKQTQETFKAFEEQNKDKFSLLDELANKKKMEQDLQAHLSEFTEAGVDKATAEEIYKMFGPDGQARNLPHKQWEVVLKAAKGEPVNLDKLDVKYGAKSFSKTGIGGLTGDPGEVRNATKTTKELMTLKKG